MAECKSWEFSSPGFTDGPKTQHGRNERSSAAFTSVGNVKLRKWALTSRLYRGKQSIYNFYLLMLVLKTSSHSLQYLFVPFEFLIRFFVCLSLLGKCSDYLSAMSKPYREIQDFCKVKVKYNPFNCNN